MDSRSVTLAEEKETERGVPRSPVESINKKSEAGFDGFNTDKEDGSVVDVLEQEPQDGEAGAEYPTGFRLSLIVVSLLLSIFLVCSLDERGRAQD